MPCNLRRVQLLVATWHGSFTHELIERAGIAALHVLGPEHASLIELFGHNSSRTVDKFASVRWRPGLTGAPVLEECLGYIEGRVTKSMDCGDHSVRLIEPMHAWWRDRGDEESLLSPQLRRLGIEKAFVDDLGRLE